MKWMLRTPAVTSVLLAALVVMALSLVTVGSSPKLTGQKQKNIPLEDFVFMLGQGSRHPKMLEIDQYTGGRAVVSSQYGLPNVDQYRYLAFDLSPARVNEDLPLFFWRAADSAQLHTMPLEENVLDYLELKRSRYWRGRISEFGFMFQTIDEQRWYLRSVAFLPDAPKNSLRSIFSDWLEFESWAQHSAHFINGGAANSRWSLGILVASWVFLSLLLYWPLARMAGQPPDGKRVAAILLLGWMLLDARWLYNLVQQAQVTREVYAGKTLDEQYRAGMDVDYYSYFQRLITRVLPEEPQILYVLDNNTDYYRAKVPWLLAPHNVFNRDQYPRPEYAAKGGYVLLLETMPGLWFDRLGGGLRWGQNNLLPAEPVDQDPLGVLYRILPSGK
jgi:hypothetical protein